MIVHNSNSGSVCKAAPSSFGGLPTSIVRAIQTASFFKRFEHRIKQTQKFIDRINRIKETNPLTDGIPSVSGENR